MSKSNAVAAIITLALSVCTAGSANAQFVSTAGPPDRSWGLIYCPTADSCRTGDFNGDGRSDIASFADADARVYVQLAGDRDVNGNPAFGARSIWASEVCYGGERCDVGDVDGDGKDDLIRFSATGNAITAMPSLGPFRFGQSELWRLGDFCTAAGTACLVGDVNGDSKDDLVEVNTTSGALAVSLSNGSVFGTPQTIDGDRCGTPNVCRLADVDGDGRDDLVAFTFAPNFRPVRRVGEVYVKLAGGDVLAAAWSRWAYGFFRPDDQVAVADFDGDGKADIAVFESEQPYNSYVATADDDRFLQRDDWGKGACPTPWFCAAADVNGDRVADVVRLGGGLSQYDVGVRLATTHNPNLRDFAVRVDNLLIGIDLVGIEMVVDDASVPDHVVSVDDVTRSVGDTHIPILGAGAAGTCAGGDNPPTVTITPGDDPVFGHVADSYAIVGDLQLYQPGYNRIEFHKTFFSQDLNQTSTVVEGPYEFWLSIEDGVTFRRTIDKDSSKEDVRTHQAVLGGSLPMLARDCEATWCKDGDMDGLLDLWENTLAQTVRPSFRVDTADGFYSEHIRHRGDWDRWFVTFLQIAPYKIFPSEETRILVQGEAAFDRDHGPDTHNGDPESFGLRFELVDSVPVLGGTWQTAHVETLGVPESTTVFIPWLTRRGDEGMRFFEWGRGHQPLKPRYYVEEDKHGLWIRYTSCDSNWCSALGCSASPYSCERSHRNYENLQPIAANIGESFVVGRPFVDVLDEIPGVGPHSELAGVFPGETIFSAANRPTGQFRFCGGHGDDGDCPSGLGEHFGRIIFGGNGVFSSEFRTDRDGQSVGDALYFCGAAPQ